MNKWNLIVDVAECHNCNNCFIACKDEYVGNEHKGYTVPQPLHGHKWINILTKERGQYPFIDTVYVPTMCNHCDDAPCIAEGRGAIRKRDDGIVLIDPEKARGRKDIVDSCPYGAIWWNEDLQVPQAWTFDAHLLDIGWKEPRCVQSCPTGALKAVKISDQQMDALAKDEKLQPLRPDFDTCPRVHYKNLHQYTKVFITGEVLANADRVTDCLGSARVVLSANGKQLAVTETDSFGEYLIDGLDPETGDCELTITHDDYPTKTLAVTLEGKCIVASCVLET